MHKILRPGGVSFERILQVLPEASLHYSIGEKLKEGEKTASPGMKYRHYAPKAPVTAVLGEPDDTARYIVQNAKKGDGILCFDEYAGEFKGYEVRQYGARYDHETQARRIFAALRSFDKTNVTRIMAQCPKEDGIGLAVLNRLKKASGFHMVKAKTLSKVIGITGKSGSGKSTAAAYLKSLGAKTIDADEIYKNLLKTCAPMKAEMAEAFGAVFDKNGMLDRKKLASLVFSDEKSHQKLNQITHRYVLLEMEREIKKLKEQSAPLIVIDAPLLLESGAGRFCDLIAGVIAEEDQSALRLAQRDRLSEKEVSMRLNAQPREDFYRERCDVILENRGDREDFLQKVNDLYRRMTEE